MLQLSGMLLNRPIMSLRTGTQIATTLSAIINPNNLKIDGFYCQPTDANQRLVLLYQDIRDVIPQGLVVDDVESLTDPTELVRLREVMDLQFELIGKPVVTAAKEKLGKVNDFAAETTTMFIQKIYVSQSIFKSFTGGSLGIDRNQIVEITNKKVVIRELTKRAPIQATALA